MASAPSFCGVCSRNLDEEILRDGEFMIQCDICLVWYHGKCVELEEYEAADIDNYHCQSCFAQAGPSQPKRVRNNHRYDYTDQEASGKPTESGTKRFVEELLLRKFLDASPATVTLDDGASLSSDYLARTLFGQPVLVENAAGLGLQVPASSFTADDVERYVGGDRFVDVIDVYAQHSYKMRLKAFLALFHRRNRPKLYNLISLEFSDTKLSQLVKVPSVVEEISWVDQYWPKPLHEDSSSSQKAVLNEHIAVKPEVAKFCLIGMAGSYTDFHIDFGGTSVYYHVLWGEKVFYLIEPTEKNLRLFENWQQSMDYTERFLGDLVPQCYRLVLKPGQTLFIPTGWIHAVYTPQDSLVIGGNFLHSFNIGLQIRIYEMEKRAHTADKFMFPHFELVHWYAGVHLLEMVKEHNEEKTAVKPYLLNGLKALVAAMKTWVHRNQSYSWPLANAKNSKLLGHIIIETMTCSQVLKQLEKAVRINEKIASPAKKNRKNRSSTVTKKQDKQTRRVELISVPAAFPETIQAPLQKLRVSAKCGAPDRSKGCPKSPAKMLQQQGTETVAGAAAQKVDQFRFVNTAIDKSHACEEVEDSFSALLDSAPPTPRWSDDTDEGGERRDRPGPSESDRPAPVQTTDKTSASCETRNGPSGKKVFGFSLLDIECSDQKSPDDEKPLSAALSSPPPTCSVATPAAKQSMISQNDHGLLTLSSRRPHKPTQLSAKPCTAARPEYFPGLGYCRKDDEFVYPSLSDSETPDAIPKKRRKAAVKELRDKTENALKGSSDSAGPSRKRKPKREDTESSPRLSAAANDTHCPTASKPLPAGLASLKPKKMQKGTTKQRLANKLKIRKIITM